MLRPVQPYVEYVLNQDYIAEFLCINKDKPELKCNGKCHLMKQFQEQQKSEPSSSLPISMENYPIGFVIIQSIVPFQYFISSDRISQFNYNALYTFQYTYGEIHPPEFV